ncbi:ABC transporter permease [Kineococcus sp. SYSU DK001]|uniref:ABC transporter permease n=1 Tax=Kineococcus sp. SYSU DK001 TaxID=3383122 RepID=UPI003D7C961D
MTLHHPLRRLPQRNHHTAACSPVLNAVRAGLRRSLIEVRQNLPLVVNYAFFPLIALLVVHLLRGTAIPGAAVGLGTHAVPGILAVNIVFTGVMGLATTLMSERADGTLLRARTVPHGVLGYLVAKIAGQILMTFVTLAVVLVVAALLLEGLQPFGVGRLLTLACVVPLGLLATLPFGAVLGSVVPHPRQLGLVSLSLMGLTAVSGVFYPLVAHAPWMQVTGQVFPLYWIGLGLRSAFLPAEAVTAEIDASWRIAECVTVLGVWSVAGTTTALVLLRRAARRQGGTRLRPRRR